MYFAQGLCSMVCFPYLLVNYELSSSMDVVVSVLWSPGEIFYNVSDSYDLEETTRNLKSKSFIDVVLEVENAVLEDGVQREKQGISRLRQLLSKEFFSEEV